MVDDGAAKNSLITFVSFILFGAVPVLVMAATMYIDFHSTVRSQLIMMMMAKTHFSSLWGFTRAFLISLS